MARLCPRFSTVMGPVCAGAGQNWILCRRSRKRMFWALDSILMSTDTEGRDSVGITSIFIALVFTCNEPVML